MPQATERHGEKWAKRELCLLGKAPDAEIGARIGRTAKAVESKRRELGTPPFTLHQREWTKREVRLLGKVADAEVARRLGVDRQTVLRKRKALGIKAYSLKNRPSWLEEAG